MTAKAAASRPVGRKPALAAKSEWPADSVERRPLASLVPYARNARTHSDGQVAQIAASMREWGWTNPVLIDEDGGIIAGHGRVLAARSLGYAEVPVMVARGWTEAQRRAYVLADNQLALNAEWDAELLSVELEGLGELGFDTALLGFPEDADSDAPAPAGDAGSNYREQYGVIVICKDAAHQERVYNEMLEAGHECRVVVT